MPAAPDHYRFALSVLTELKGFSARSASERAVLRAAASVTAPSRRRLVLLGCQGPDPFFFYGSVPWRRRNNAAEITAFGAELHHADPAEYLADFGAVVSAIAAPDREAGFAFLFGLGLHYVLDRAVHPYVFYESGFDEEGELTGHWKAAHAYFETLLTEAGGHGQRARLYRPKRLFQARTSEVEMADRLFAAAYPDPCQPGRYAASWRDMTTVLETLWDSSGLKRLLLKKLLGGDSQAYAMIRPRGPEKGDSTDYLNKSRRFWRYPADGRVSNESVTLLYQRARADAQRFLRLILSVLDADATFADPDWPLFFGGVNHDGLKAGESLNFKRADQNSAAL